MARAKKEVKKDVEFKKKETEVSKGGHGGRFHVEFLNSMQKIAWGAFQQQDVLFLCGPAGTGKSFLAMAFAINEILQKKKKKIILTRPIIEAGESIGYLPGSASDKVAPYMLPLYDSLSKLVGENGPQRDLIERSIEVAPLNYMRGRTFDDSICIFDEAQNATMTQLKLFLTRMGQDSKIIVTGDPTQSDIPVHKRALMDVVYRLETLPGVSVINFKAENIVRHSLIAEILERLDDSQDDD